MGSSYSKNFALTIGPVLLIHLIIKIINNQEMMPYLPIMYLLALSIFLSTAFEDCSEGELESNEKFLPLYTSTEDGILDDPNVEQDGSNLIDAEVFYNHSRVVEWVDAIKVNDGEKFPNEKWNESLQEAFHETVPDFLAITINEDNHNVAINMILENGENNPAIFNDVNSENDNIPENNYSNHVTDDNPAFDHNANILEHNNFVTDTNGNILENNNNIVINNNQYIDNNGNIVQHNSLLNDYNGNIIEYNDLAYESNENIVDNNNNDGNNNNQDNANNANALENSNLANQTNENIFNNNDNDNEINPNDSGNGNENQNGAVQVAELINILEFNLEQFDNLINIQDNFEPNLEIIHWEVADDDGEAVDLNNNNEEAVDLNNNNLHM